MNFRFVLLAILLFGGAVAAEAQIRFPRPPKRPVSTGKAVAPTTQAITGEIGLGSFGGYAAATAGLEYERFVMTPQWLSAAVRVGGYLGGTINLGGELEKGEVFSQNRGFFVAPGMRFHPLRNRRRADLGLGVYLPLGVDIRRDDAPGSINLAGTTSGFLGACVGELSINLRPAAPRRAIFGFFGTVGYCYSNDPAVTYTYPDGRPSASHSEADPLIVRIKLT